MPTLNPNYYVSHDVLPRIGAPFVFDSSVGVLPERTGVNVITAKNALSIAGLDKVMVSHDPYIGKRYDARRTLRARLLRSDDFGLDVAGGECSGRELSIGVNGSSQRTVTISLDFARIAQGVEWVAPERSDESQAWLTIVNAAVSKELLASAFELNHPAIKPWYKGILSLLGPVTFAGVLLQDTRFYELHALLSENPLIGQTTQPITGLQ